MIIIIIKSKLQESQNSLFYHNNLSEEIETKLHPNPASGNSISENNNINKAETT
ncbi:MAG TPA: hypothetical protein GX005_05630 [Bacteroidales bacterium]|nr:hypothetical protein [Bacteroidales bacterium]